MAELFKRTKLDLLLHGNSISDNFKNNSLYFYEQYTKTTKEFNAMPVSKMSNGGFYFLHYQDESNWMKYSPIFLADYRKMSGKVIAFGVNFNFIPLEVRVLLFDKYITEKDFEDNNYLKVDLQGIYDELRRLGFEYALNEYDVSRIKVVHKVSLDILPRFLYHQHPKNKYDPMKLMQIWEAKLAKREQRHREMTLSLLSDFYDVNSEISEKYDVLKGHIKRLQRNIKKY
jgi:hypothetical protein